MYDPQRRQGPGSVGALAEAESRKQHGESITASISTTPNADPREQFRAAIAAAGLTAPSTIIADGALHRFPSNGKRGDNAGWYVLHDDGIAAGAFGCWRSDTSETWCADPGRTLTAEEKAEQRRRIEAASAARAEAEKAMHAEAAERAQKEWQAACAANDQHPYLLRKRVKAHGLRVDDEGRLLVPVRDSSGRLMSLQRIGPDGEKRFFYGGHVAGGYFIIGAPGDTVCIAEGYATAASIHEATGHAVAVAFNAGNLPPVARTMREKFPTAKLIVCGDDDSNTPRNPGRTKAREAAQAVGALLALPDFGTDRPEGASDFNDMAAHRGADAVRLCIAAPSSTAEAPEPLRRPVPAAEPYPIAELGPLLQPAVASLCRVIQAPDAVCASSVLAAASLAAQSLANIEVDGRVYPLSLFMLTIAESGERKSAVDAEALRAARAVEKSMVQAYDTEFEAHRWAMAEWEARCDAAKRDASKAKGRGLADALESIGPQPPAPLAPTMIVSDFTAEGLAKLLAVSRPSVGAFTDEAALVFGGHGMTKETVARTAATLSKLWDAGSLDRVRSLDGATKLYGRRLALHLMAQPIIAERALSDEVLSGQGFLARCLLAWPSSTAGTRPYRAESLATDPAMQRLKGRLTELHSEPLPIAEDTRQELAPPSLKLTSEAKAAWVKAHDVIEAAMRPGGQFETVKAWASKTPEQILRIAGVLTVLESREALSMDGCIVDVQTIGRAAEIGLWHLHEALRLRGAAEVSPEVRNAEALLAWCHETGREILHSSAALRLGPSRIRERSTFRAAMAELVAAGWADEIEGGTDIDGAHRRHVWRITPAAREV
ncbi:MAG: DUF3987 domain-containing protein [Gammaproteobacteria bacterium]|nr:DUF3987 domain-containing protein [Gammaproteobacteria bacterium]